MKNGTKIDPKTYHYLEVRFGSIFHGFWRDLGVQNRRKMGEESIMKRERKTEGQKVPQKGARYF